MTVITRIAPSPTGFLHIGTARTALFNWLYAKHHGGKFFLRIEDTDRERSTDEATKAILTSLEWLGLKWDGDVVYQFARASRHAEVAKEMMAKGHAYYCYTTSEELTKFRNENPGAKFRSKWRDGGTPPAGVPPVIRIKAPMDGETTVDDKVQGKVSVKNTELDDMVLLRSDGTPTYMLAVVVDDHDMGVTQIIRGDDHLTNTFRQLMIYNAMGWEAPHFAHIPLIHGADGAKLSKRHGALGVQEYEKMGYLPEAVCNYLLRLGWSHGDDEVISTKQAIEWFDLDAVGKSPSRFDFAKLENVNGHYIREADDARLVDLITPLIETKLGSTITPIIRERLIKGMPGLKQRAKTLIQLADGTDVYIQDEKTIGAKAPALLQEYFAKKPGGETAIQKQIELLENMPAAQWNRVEIENSAKALVEELKVKLGDIAQPLRIGLSASTVTPPIFEVLEILGKDESLKRLRYIKK